MPSNTFCQILNKGFYFISSGNTVSVQYTDLKVFDTSIDRQILKGSNKINIHDSSAVSEQYQITQFFIAFIELSLFRQQYDEWLEYSQISLLANLLYQVIDELTIGNKGLPVAIKIMNKTYSVHFNDERVSNFGCTGLLSHDAQSIHITDRDVYGNIYSQYTQYQIFFHEIWHLLFSTIGLDEDEYTYGNEQLIDMLGYLTAELYLTANNQSHKKSFDKLLEANKI